MSRGKGTEQESRVDRCTVAGTILSSAKDPEGGAMGVAAITVEQIAFLRQASHKPARLAHKLEELTRYAQQLQREVEERWPELSPKEREALVSLAYEVVEPPQTLGQKVVIFLNMAKLGIALARGQVSLEDLGRFLSAVNGLVRSVMDRLEEENPSFQEALQKALAEESTPLTRDELRALILDD
ncbi:hypothetical protein [Thermus sp.]|uniref:hypothetical protein n=1 Tax=Thermus sp. TaxID=275 RepID=UPI002616DB5C|nr:hypothetical protein [Thermus sp.]MCX7850754.1 hypothetical protein [Thermus sp.]